MKKVFLLMVAIAFLQACKKNDNQCKTSAEVTKVTLNINNKQVGFISGNAADNIYLAFLDNKDSLNSIIGLLNIPLLDSLNNSVNIVSLNVFLETMDVTDNTGSAIGADLSGILVYIKDSIQHKTRTLAYIKENGVMQWQDYLSTSAVLIANKDIKVFKGLSGARSVLSFIRNKEGLLNSSLSDYYAEFSYRLVYEALNRGWYVSCDSKCNENPECPSSALGTCIPQENQFGGEVWRCVPCNCGVEGAFGVQPATPISYTASDETQAKNELYYFRDHILLSSKKGVSYVSLFYYLSNKMDAGFLSSQAPLYIQVIFENILPVVFRLRDESYTGTVINAEDLDRFRLVLIELQERFVGDPDIDALLGMLATDLEYYSQISKAATLTHFLNS
ncbi:MAG: hypothetical protein BGO29_10985 [Bacteroidales bacterium 36-12]|nr:MAG: hypothetical protein BGO09_05635 [Bacteroidetes bacterium 47-18]OJV44707.1 MAG: hypothetical protein BGO29_10985 [Bacteroidales bacterium 36-12]